MTKGRLTVLSAVLIVLTLGRTGALSMVVSLAALRTCRSCRAAVARVAVHQQRSHRSPTRRSRSTIQSRYPARSRVGGLAWTLLMTSRAVSLAPEGPQQRLAFAMIQDFQRCAPSATCNLPFAITRSQSAGERRCIPAQELSTAVALLNPE